MRRLTHRALLFCVCLLIAACSGGGTDAASTASAAGDELVVERVEIKGFETVRNVSGSKWGGDATLVEELAIGEEIGDDPYLFGGVTAAWATPDRIYVVDSQVPAVRAYDHQGNYLHDLGQPGDGPGEYRMPTSIGIDNEGRVLVSDVMGARLNLYDDQGSSLESWSLGSIQSAMGMFLSDEGHPYTRAIEMPENMQFDGSMPDMKMGMQRVGPEGPIGEKIMAPESDYEPPTVELEIFGNTLQMPIIPLVPSFQWSFTPGGEMVYGVGTDYRFEIRYADGTIRAVERYWEPVEVNPEERSWRAEQASEGVARMAEDFSLDEDLVPTTKPAFQLFQPDRSGRVWVVREGPAYSDPECIAPSAPGRNFSAAFSSGGDVRIAGPGGSGGRVGGGGSTAVLVGPGGGGWDDDPMGCWASTYMLDVFDIATGEFLGSVQSPERGFTVPLFVEGDTVIAAVPDELETVRVKKYRMQLPGDG